MWEFCLYFEKEQLEYILALKKHLKKFFKKHKGAVVLYEEKQKIFIATTAGEKSLIPIYSYIYNYIVYIIYTYYKRKILNQISSEIFNSDIFELVIKETLFCFDEEFDKKEIRRHLFLDETLNLEGFFNFKLNELKNKWEHLVDLIKNNSCVLNNYIVNLDLSRYLLAELDNNIDKVCLFSEGNKYLLKTINNEKLTYKKINFSKKQSFKQLIKSLIMLSPKNIILCSEIKNEEFNILKELFLDKL